MTVRVPLDHYTGKATDKHFSWSSNTLAAWCEGRLIGKDPDAGKNQGKDERGATKDEMVGWHHQLNRHEFEQSLEDKDRVCCSQSTGFQSVGHDWAAEQQQQAPQLTILLGPAF